jgi:hypothetical protein
VDTTKVPLLATANTFTGTQTITGNLALPLTNASGTQGVISVSGSPFIHDYGVSGSYNSFFGFEAGNLINSGSYLAAVGDFALESNTTGSGNTAVGDFALESNTTGSANTTAGADALRLNSTGDNNTANGFAALYSNTTGGGNTANGNGALEFNTTGGNNTANGIWALLANTTGNTNTATGASAGVTADSNPLTGSNNTALGAGTAFGLDSITNATAIGADAEVTTSNSLVLGAIAGVNGGTDTFVGIGTTAPTNLLTLVGDIKSPADTVLSITSPSIDGTWISLNNTYDSGGRNWNIISAGPGDGEGDGALVFNNMQNGTVVIDGNLNVSGSVSKGSGSFKIDHPLDPANKYLYHSFVESPDMMDVYNGNVITNQHGLATVILPDYSRHSTANSAINSR